MPWSSMCSWPESNSHVGILNFSSHCQFGGFCLVEFCLFTEHHCNLPVFLQDSWGEQGSHRLLGTQHFLSHSTEKPSRAPEPLPGKSRRSGTRNSSHPKGTNAQKASHSRWSLFLKREAIKDWRPAFSWQVFNIGLRSRFFAFSSACNRLSRPDGACHLSCHLQMEPVGIFTELLNACFGFSELSFQVQRQ